MHIIKVSFTDKSSAFGYRLAFVIVGEIQFPLDNFEPVDPDSRYTRTWYGVQILFVLAVLLYLMLAVMLFECK